MSGNVKSPKKREGAEEIITFNQGVAGSSPAWLTKKNTCPSEVGGAFCCHKISYDLPCFTAFYRLLGSQKVVKCGLCADNGSQIAGVFIAAAFSS
jgi:hypothetical protein